MAETEGGDLPPLRKALEERKRQRDLSPEPFVQDPVQAAGADNDKVVGVAAKPAVSEHKARAQSAVAAVEAWGDVDAGADYSNAGAMDGVFETAAMEASDADRSEGVANEGASAALKAAQAARTAGHGQRGKVEQRGQGQGVHGKDKSADGRERFEVMEQARARHEKAAQGAARGAVDARVGQGGLGGQGGQGEQEQTYGQRVREQEEKKAREEAAKEKAARSDKTKAGARTVGASVKAARVTRDKKREWALPSVFLSPHGALFLMAVAVCFLTTPWLAAVFIPFAVSFANGTWDKGWGVLPFPSAVFAVSAALWFFA